MIGFIDDHRVAHGVESICRVLPIAPSTYYACLAVRADPSKASARQQRDVVLRPKIQKVWDDNWKVYGVRKAWRQLCREGEAVARCTVARLMTRMGLRGIVSPAYSPNTRFQSARERVGDGFDLFCGFGTASRDGSGVIQAADG